MDEIDQNQQKQIDKLQEHANDNKQVDRIQWLAIATLVGALLYMNMGLFSVLNSQANTIHKIAEVCRK